MARQSEYEKHEYVNSLLQMTEQDKFIDVNKLSKGGKLLTRFEPDEIVEIKSATFRVIRVQLDPPLLVLVPRD